MVRASGIGHRASGIGRFVGLVVLGASIASVVPLVVRSRGAASSAQSLTYPQIVFADGAVSYWRLGDPAGPALDLIGGRNGTYSANATRSLGGAIALDANGSVTLSPLGESVTLPGAGLPNLTEARTIEFWMKSPSYTNFSRILKWGDMSIFASDQTSIDIQGTSGFTQNYQVGDGYWHHVAVVYSNGVVRLYVDGKDQISRSVSSIANSGSAITLGALGTGGSLDEVAVYSAGLTPSQIANHFRSGLVGSCMPAAASDAYMSAVIASGAVGFWRFDESSGSRVIRDSVGCRPGLYQQQYVSTATSPNTTYLAPRLEQPGAVIGGGTSSSSINSSVGSISTTGLPSGSSPRSLEFWAKYVNSPGSPYVSWGEGIVQGGDLEADAWPTSDQTAWHHVVVSYSAGVMSRFIDGVLVGAVSLPSQSGNEE
jgi:hypothetical protein